VEYLQTLHKGYSFALKFEHGKNGFVTATKLASKEFFVASTKNFAAATKRFVEN